MRCLALVLLVLVVCAAATALSPADAWARATPAKTRSPARHDRPRDSSDGDKGDKKNATKAVKKGVKKGATKGEKHAAKKDDKKDDQKDGRKAEKKDPKAGRDHDDDEKPLTAKEKKKAQKEHAALQKECADKKAARTKKCKLFLQDERDRQDATAAEALDSKCSAKKNKKLKECKAFLAKGSRAEADPCGRKYGRARKKESIARFARRYGVTEATVRRLNDMGDGAHKLKAGKRYLVAKSPHDGVVLAGGVQMPLDGTTFRLRRPQNAWGKPLMVEALQAASTAVQASFPLGATVMIGDLSKNGGGCLPPHKSHRGGLDVDVGYYLRGGVEPKTLADATGETLDADRSWQFLKALLASGRVQYAFVHYKLQPALYDAALRAGETPESLHKLIQYPRPPEKVLETPIRHLDGHDDHVHLRLTCGDEACALDPDARAKMLATRTEMLGGPVHEGRAGRTARRSAYVGVIR